MFEYAVTVRTKSGETYRMSLSRPENNMALVHNLLEKVIAERYFLYMDNSYMLRTSEIEAFKAVLKTKEEKQND